MFPFFEKVEEFLPLLIKYFIEYRSLFGSNIVF